MRLELLERLEACDLAIEWLETQPDAETAWRECLRGDWMIWLLGRLFGQQMPDQRRKFVRAACDCARTALHHIPPWESRPRAALETVERWADGDTSVTPEELRAAASAAARVSAGVAAYSCYAAAEAVFAVAETASVYASHAADIAYPADSAVDAVTYSASAYTSCAIASAHDEGRRTVMLARLADIVRKHFPEPPITQEAS